MKTLEKINNYPILVFIVLLNDLYEFILRFKIISFMDTTLNSFDWFDFIIKVIIAVLLWIVLKYYLKLKREIEEKNLLFTLITHERNKRLFAYFQQRPARENKDTDESYYKKLPAGGLFDKYFKEEFNYIKPIVINLFKDKKIEEINILLSDYYPDDFTGIKK